MNCLWPATARFSFLNPRTIFQSCRKLDSLATRLAERHVRLYSISSVPFRRKDLLRLEGGSKAGHFQRKGLRLGNIRTFTTRNVVTRFEDLPQGYRDEKGLAFRSKSLSLAETKIIFGDTIDTSLADQLLRQLHGRRVAGTLEDPNLSQLETLYGPQALDIALEYLRKEAPVDEVYNAGLRAEQELEEMNQDYIPTDRSKIYEPNSGDIPGRKWDSVSAKSALDALRAAKEKQFNENVAAEKKRQAEEAKNAGPLATSGGSKVVLRTPGSHPRLQHYLERAKILPETPPDMTKFQRLGPSGAVVLLTVFGCLLFAQIYVPPKHSARIWPEIPPAVATLASIFLLNTAILIAWRVPFFFRGLNKYFITVPGYPFALSLIGSIFSHQSPYHFGVNMLVLCFVGSRLHDQIGRGNFLAVYLGTGVLAGYASLIPWVVTSTFISSSLGASGAVFGVVSCYLWLNRSEGVRILGLFPPEDWPTIPSAVVLLLLIGFEISAILKFRKTGYIKHQHSHTANIKQDNWAHLGGLLSGVVAAELLRGKALRKKEAERERRRKLEFMDRIKEGRL